MTKIQSTFLNSAVFLLFLPDQASARSLSEAFSRGAWSGMIKMTFALAIVGLIGFLVRGSSKKRDVQDNPPLEQQAPLIPSPRNWFKLNTIGKRFGVILIIVSTVCFLILVLSWTINPPMEYAPEVQLIIEEDNNKKVPAPIVTPEIDPATKTHIAELEKSLGLLRNFVIENPYEQKQTTPQTTVVWKWRSVSIDKTLFHEWVEYTYICCFIFFLGVLLLLGVAQLLYHAVCGKLRSIALWIRHGSSGH